MRRDTVSLPVEHSTRGMRVTRVHVDGVDMGGPPYTARIFLNRPDATPRTETDAAHGYAGAFHVYGLGLKPPEPRLVRRTVHVTGDHPPSEPVTSVTLVAVRSDAPSESAGAVFDEDVLRVSLDFEGAPKN